MTKQEKNAMKIQKAKAQAAKAQAKADKLQKKVNTSKTAENLLMFGAIVGMVCLAITAAVVSMQEESEA